MQNRQLTSDDELTQLARLKGIRTWRELLVYVRGLPYGRIANRREIGLVLSQERGTCSSKHALLKQIADLNGIPGIELTLCIYRMNAFNTPDIGSVLAEHGLDCLPEAHCYLKIEGQPMDFTFSNADFNRIGADVLFEQAIQPAQAASFKEDFHRQFLQKWIEEKNLELTFEQVWEIREKCIGNLIQSANH